MARLASCSLHKALLSGWAWRALSDLTSSLYAGECGWLGCKLYAEVLCRRGPAIPGDACRTTSCRPRATLDFVPWFASRPVDCPATRIPALRQPATHTHTHTAPRCTSHAGSPLPLGPWARQVQGGGSVVWAAGLGRGLLTRPSGRVHAVVRLESFSRVARHSLDG
jgi:hypothetical protein